MALGGLPLFIILSLTAVAGFSSENLTLSIFFAEFIRLAENPILVAIPLFTLAGYILAESNAGNRLVRFASFFLGWLPGSLAVVSIIGMALFTAFSGASGVSIVAMGGLLFPAMLKGNYQEKFSLGLITISGSVGLLFPPSLPLIIYGVVSNTPVQKMFFAGIVPGIIMVTGLSLYSIRHGFKFKVKQEIPERSFLTVIKESAWELPLPVIVLGGIYSGFFSIGDVAIITVIYLIIVECFLTRDINLIKDMPRILKETSVLAGGILLILGSALALTNYLVYIDLPTIIIEKISIVVSGRIGFLILLNIFLLVVGCLMDVFSALIVVVPLILPIAIKFGIDPVHLGIIFLTNLEIGYNTPPEGLNLFISSFRFNRPVLKLYKAALPFLIIQIIILLIITYIPILTLYPVEVFTK